VCGINGLLRLTPDAPPVDRGELLRVRDAMASRGPDGAGEWRAPDGRVALAHRRLAIIDLSPAGAQPMESRDGRFVLVFNGEIYNYRELREELLAHGVPFRSHSDSEVILELFARDGEASLGRLRGMFALALWDRRAEALTLARDGYGIKPLYYCADDGTLRFASQVRALESDAKREVEPAGVVGFLLWGSVPEPWTLRRGVRAVPAGHALTVVGGRVGTPRPLATPRAAPDETTAEAAIAASIEAHLVADVPVGVFLSAGLDSALVAALACRQLAEPPVTLTVAFDAFRGTGRDEAPLAAAVARELGTRHVEHRLDSATVEALWPRAVRAMDQPSIDGFNVFLVSHAARQEGLKVVLSGLGGDELFGSYPSFRDVPRWQRWSGRAEGMPGVRGAWSALARVLARPKLRGLDRYGGSLAGAYFLRRGLFLPEELPALIGPEAADRGLAAYDPIADAQRVLGGESDPWLAVHRLESGLYLRNQLLRDADWASMAHSVELRVPFADGRLTAALARARFEPARSGGKASLVRRLAPSLPAALYTRRKTGFGVPRATSAGVRAGLASRTLARELLAGFGVETGASPGAAAS
jgi:asparagine synthase (glutamine-hydrolysing)